ncbi:hypothetical protein F5148DRAFT_1013108 [Russula earlei]|uniref:Uncharacterized protein n=1 Tax=Russula earlei TaxID=71964 RepID=A0ACC0UB78_9AGAM|nr:hypothetical protein F5148DRAFT_1013108 [Russula earlei]
MISHHGSDPTHPLWRTRTSSVLTALAHGTAPFITTFLFIHLSAPIVANIGGSSDASRTMTFGRQYYQTVFGERYLVFGPLLVHTTSAFLKRMFSPRPSRPLANMLSATGYASMLFLLPVHVVTHRLGPANPAPPVSATGASDLDFEFVKVALREWPVRTTVLYAAIVLGVALHAADGFGVIWSTWVQKIKRRRRWVRRALAGVVALPVLTGLAVIAREPSYAFAFTAARYRAALAYSFVYRL